MNGAGAPLASPDEASNPIYKCNTNIRLAREVAQVIVALNTDLDSEQPSQKFKRQFLGLVHGPTLAMVYHLFFN
jgi:hypothetical protein